PDVGVTLRNLGRVESALGRYDLAENLYARALAILEQAQPASQPAIGETLNELELARVAKRHQEYFAAKNYAAALAEAQKLEAAPDARFGTDHSWYAGALSRMAHVYRAQANYEEARRLYQRALPIIEKSKGDNHPDVGWTLVNLGRVESALGRYAPAEKFYG